MFNWFMVLFGMGPVQRAINERMREAIRKAEAQLVVKHESLDKKMKAEMDILRTQHEYDRNRALGDIVTSLLR